VPPEGFRGDYNPSHKCLRSSKKIGPSRLCSQLPNCPCYGTGPFSQAEISLLGESQGALAMMHLLRVPLQMEEQPESLFTQEDATKKRGTIHYMPGCSSIRWNLSPRTLFIRFAMPALDRSAMPSTPERGMPAPPSPAALPPQPQRLPDRAAGFRRASTGLVVPLRHWRQGQA
jgi:hypothetical protein